MPVRMVHEDDLLPNSVPPSCMQLREWLRTAASALKEHGPRFALAGSYALWAYGVNGVPVEEATLDRAEQRDVLAIAMPVLPPTLVLIQKLRSLGEHHCDFASLLPAVRAIRERLDWELIKAQTADNDFAVAFLVLVGRLGLIS